MANSRVGRGIVFGWLLLALAGSAQGAMVLESSGGQITHRAGFADVSQIVQLGALPAYNANTYQYNTTANAATPTLRAGSAASNGRFGMGVVNSPDFIGVGFATGSLLTQSGNGNPLASTASLMRVDFNATWLNTGPSAYGSGLRAGASFGLIGQLPSSSVGGAFVEISISATFLDQDPLGQTTLLRGPISPTPFYANSTPGRYVFSRSDQVPTALPTIAVGHRLLLVGFIQFRVHNDGDESSMEFNAPSGVLGGDNPAAFIPAPGASALLGFAGMLAARRRRA